MAANSESNVAIGELNDNPVENIEQSPQNLPAFQWDIHGNRSAALEKLYQDKAHIDIALITQDGGQELVNYSVVSALGPIIGKHIEVRLLTTYGQKSTHQDELGNTNTVYHVHLPKIGRYSLKVIAKYAYTGRVELGSRQDIYMVLEDAERFQITTLVVTCCKFICTLVDDKNCVDLLLLGQRLDHASLQCASRRAIQKNFMTISNQPDKLKKINYNQLLRILQSDYVNCASEAHIARTILSWTRLRMNLLALPVERYVDRMTQLLSAIRHLRIEKSERNDVLADQFVNQYDLLKQLVKKWAKDKDKFRSSHKIDGYELPAACQPLCVRPRIPGSVIFAFGGWKSGTPCHLFETFDTCTNQWFMSANHQGPQKAYCGIEYYKGMIWIVGGTNGANLLSSLNSYDPVRHQWNEHVDMAWQRCYVSTAILDDKLYAIGGHNGEHRMRSVEVYDFVKEQWSPLADMNVARSDGSASILNGLIYVLGGLNEHQIESSVEFYDPRTDTWTLVQSMTSPRTSLSSVTCGEYIYALGGNSGVERLRSGEKYDPKTDTWTLIENMHSKRSTFSATVFEGQIVCVGGYDGNTPIKKVECYDPAINTWRQLSSMAYDRSGLAVITLTDLPRNVIKRFTFLGHNKDSLLQSDPDECPLDRVDEVIISEQFAK